MTSIIAGTFRDGVLAGRDVPGAVKTLQAELEKIAR